MACGRCDFCIDGLPGCPVEENGFTQLEALRAKCSQLERDNLDLRCLADSLVITKSSLTKALDLKNKYMDEREALKLELNATKHTLSIAVDQERDARERAYRYHQTIDMLVDRLQRYRKAVRGRLTTIAERVGLGNAAYQARVEELEKENVALFRDFQQAMKTTGRVVNQMTAEALTQEQTGIKGLLP